jgi:hypothetical protein
MKTFTVYVSRTDVFRIQAETKEQAIAKAQDLDMRYTYHGEQVDKGDRDVCCDDCADYEVWADPLEEDGEEN